MNVARSIDRTNAQGAPFPRGGRHKDGHDGPLRPHPALETAQGSHTFPGQDGGTCINEAAVVAAGFPYQPVGSVENMPDCFSRPICRFAMHLNDEADDEERQLLLPFVTRLACADTPTVEREREAYIAARRSWRLSFRDRLAILEGVLAIGRQADMPGPEAISSRMATVQQNAATATSVEEYPLCSQFQGWFAGIF